MRQMFVSAGVMLVGFHLCGVVSKLFAKKVEKLFDANADASGLSENASTLYRSV